MSGTAITLVLLNSVRAQAYALSVNKDHLPPHSAHAPKLITKITQNQECSSSDKDQF